MELEHPRLTSSGAHPPVLRSVEAEGRLDGLLLTMALRQTFANDTDETLEVNYTFPLAWGAVLTGLHVTLGERRLNGRVMARHAARERYEDAVQDGDAPVMVEQVREGLFSASLGSLMPGETALIELHYAQLLDLDQGRIRLMLPTTIAPRYGDPLHGGGLSPDQVTTPDALAEHRFGLSLRLCGAVAAARIGSPTHAIDQQRQGDEVLVRLQRPAWLDRDFVLLLEGLHGQAFALAGPDAASGDGHVAVLLSQCPTLPEATPAPLRLKLLVDCSGSMAGDSMAQARDALCELVQTLGPRDRVAFSRFGSAPQRVLAAAAAEPAHRRALLAAINATDADLGGTELAEALNDSFALPMGDGADDETALLLITDGEVWGAQALVDAARRSGHRIHALGVGSAPAESLLRELAQASGGDCGFATPNESMAQVIRRLLARMRTTVPVQARLDAGPRVLWHSPLPRRIGVGETVHLAMRLASAPDGAPSLRIDDGEIGVASLVQRDDDLVARLVAAREIALCQDAEQAATLAERYQLVTAHTNLLLVIERAQADKTDGMPALHAVRPMLAAGWGGTGSTQRAAPMPMGFSIDRSFDVQYSIADPTFFDITSVSSVQRTRRQPSVDRMLIDTFNAAVAAGLGLRQAVRRLCEVRIGQDLQASVDSLAVELGGALKAWVVWLLWQHEHGGPSTPLSPQALALLQALVQRIDADTLARAHSQLGQPSMSTQALPSFIDGL